MLAAAAPIDRATRAAAPSASLHATSAAMAAKLARREEIVRASRRSVDALSFVRWLMPAARTGDTEAQKAIADQLRSCYWVEHQEIRGKTWRQLLQNPNWSPSHRAEIEQQLTKCEPLNAASEDEVGSYGEWMQQAVAGGDGSAILEQSRVGEDRSVEDQVADFHRAVATGDPAVLRAIVASYAYESDGFSWGSKHSEDTLAQMQLLNASIDLAECRLGADCSTQAVQENCGASWSQYDCSYADNLRSYYELHLSRQDFARADGYAQTLADEFLSGEYQWPEATAYENLLRSQSKGEQTSGQ